VGEQFRPMIDARWRSEVFADDGAPLGEQLTFTESHGVILEGFPTDQERAGVLLLNTLCEREVNETLRRAQYLGHSALHSSFEGRVIFGRYVDNSNLVNHAVTLTS